MIGLLNLCINYIALIKLLLQLEQRIISRQVAEHLYLEKIFRKLQNIKKKKKNGIQTIITDRFQRFINSRIRNPDP